MSATLSTVLGGLATLPESDLRKVADVVAALLPKEASPVRDKPDGPASGKAVVVTPSSSVDDIASLISDMRYTKDDPQHNADFRALMSAVRAASELPSSGPRGYEVRNAIKAIRVAWNKVPRRLLDLFE